MKFKHLSMGLLFVLAAMLISACNGPSRAASTPVVVPGQDTAGQPADSPQQPDGVATDAPSQVETMIAAGDLLATMTAAAVENSDTQPQPEATEAPVDTQPQADSPTAVPPTAVPPTATPKPPEPTPKPKVDCSSPYTVVKGDWVWDIGRRCNIDPNSIIAVNGLTYPFVIYAGDILILPANAPAFTGP